MRDYSVTPEQIEAIYAEATEYATEQVESEPCAVGEQVQWFAEWAVLAFIEESTEDRPRDMADAWDTFVLVMNAQHGSAFESWLAAIRKDYAEAADDANPVPLSDLPVNPDDPWGVERLMSGV